MRIVAIVLALTAGLVVGCADENELYLPRLTLLSHADEAESPVSRAQFCRFAREALGLPVLVDSKLRGDVYAALGKPKASELFRPLARANNSFRCLCGSPEELSRAKC